MRPSFVAVCLSATLLACAGSDTKPALTLTPSGTQTVTGPQLVTASEADVTWTVSSTAGGTGTLSGTTGISVVYQPPPTPNSSGVVTATTADGRTASVTFNTNPSSAVIPGGQLPGLTAAVQVLIDAQGIPHIFCATVTDCFEVQGFLHAQDRLFEMDFFRRTAQGQLSSLIGKLGNSQDAQLLRVFTTRDGQTAWKKMASAIDPASSAKLTAYVAGVNAYLAFLRAHPQLMPGEYAQIPGPVTPGDIADWKPEDSFAIGRLQQFQLSETIEEETGYGLIASVYQSSSPGRLGAHIRAQQPIQDYTIPLAATSSAQPAATQMMDLSPWMEGLAAVNAGMRELHETFGSMRLGAGSNNWVVNAGKSANGKALVANDPHLQLFYPPLFHLAAMTSADGALDVAGGTFPGVPGALVGRGKNVGWGVTVVGYDVTDVYLETPITTGCPAGKTCVVFNGGPVPLVDVTYDVPNFPPNNKFTVHVVPHHGPIITPDGVTPMLSMRWTGHEATNDFLGFFGLNTATAVGAKDDPATATTAFGALRNYEVGAQNFVLADDQGHIGYDPHAMVPSRPWAGTARDPGTGTPVPLLPWLPLPGTGVAEWGDSAANCDGATPAPTCFVADNLLPQSVDPDQGFLVTANSDPIGTTDDNNPVVNPGGVPYLSFDWDDPTTVRFETISKRLRDTLAGPAGKISMDDMQRIQGDHTIQVAGLFLAAPQFAASVPANGNAHTALTMLQAWQAHDFDCPTGLTGTSPSSAPSADATVLQNSAACLLFHQFLRTLLANVFNDDFAFVQHAAGQNPGADAGRQIRTMLFMLGIDPNVSTVGTEFCTNVNTTTGAVAPGGNLKCADQVNVALNSAFTTIASELGAPPAAGATTTTWLWGKFHTLTTLSPAAPLVAGGFSGGPFARPGGALSVDVGNPDGTQSTPLGFTYSHGSNVRFIGEIEAPATSTILMQLPGLEHDQQFGVFANGTDLLTPYAANQYFQYFIGHEVDAHAVSSQGFDKP